MNYLSMAALVVMGAILAGCAKETPAAEEDKIVTLSVSVGLPEDESTKALDIDYVNKTVVKTFAEGETIAVIYKSGESTLKAVSDPLPAGDYGKSATFEVSLSSPNENSPIRIIYPAARAKMSRPARQSIAMTQPSIIQVLIARMVLCQLWQVSVTFVPSMVHCQGLQCLHLLR